MSESLSIIQSNQTQPQSTSQTGARGELLAANFLIREGYRLVLSNFKVPVGRNSRGALITGEIDLVAYEAEKLCFIEVKTRVSGDFASPLAAIDLRKQRQIIRAARMYRKIFHIRQAKIRYDAVSVLLPAGKRPRIELFRGFFSEDRFRKNFWADDY